MPWSYQGNDAWLDHDHAWPLRMIFAFPAIGRNSGVITRSPANRHEPTTAPLLVTSFMMSSKADFVNSLYDPVRSVTPGESSVCAKKLATRLVSFRYKSQPAT